MRRGIAEWNGEGETVGGIVVVRYGANARQVIRDVKTALDQAMKGMPAGVSYEIAYDRSALIDRAVKTLERTLIEETIVVALVIVIFLLHFRTALVPIVILPISVLAAFLIMHLQGIGSNIMSLGGIAIAIGVLVDGVIILVENCHKHLEGADGRKSHWDIIRDASVEVGPTIFYALLVVTVAFLPVFALQAQEGRLFKPLAFTKTYSMAAAAVLAVTLAPVLAGLFIRGRPRPEEKNPISRFLIWLYHPAIDFVIRWRWPVVLSAAVLVLWVFVPWNAQVVQRLPEGRLKAWAARANVLFPYQNIGSEFMPPLYEGDLLYMPTTFPGTTSAYAERVMGGTYIEFEIRRDAIARYGLTLGDVQDVLAVALGGMPIATTIEGLERYDITLRYDRDFRSNLDALRNDIAIPTPTGAQVPLGQLADLRIVNAPMSIKSESAVPNAWVYVDIRGVDVGGYVRNAKRIVDEAVARGTIRLPEGYNLFWSGQYEYMLLYLDLA